MPSRITRNLVEAGGFTKAVDMRAYLTPMDTGAAVQAAQVAEARA